MTYTFDRTLLATRFEDAVDRTKSALIGTRGSKATLIRINPTDALHA
ncbi:hypothetical protein [Rhizobium sp. NZLR1]|nr:hypothetical protein [Rhizobium sp. NZLR1]MBX5201287.1 hypothetical protein [Rhizobium sp. NZLR1]QSZ23303.1 hypothetical protein J3O30_10775 [Rhizobium sp. NZLR1]